MADTRDQAHPAARSRQLEPSHALRELTRTRILEVLRDPTALLWTFGFPVFLTVVLGLAFRSAPVVPQPVGLACSASAAECEQVRARLSASEHLSVRELSLPDGQLALRRGKLDLLLQVQPGAALVQHFDPSRKESHTAQLQAASALDPRPSPYSTQLAPLQEPGMRYIDFLLPGVVALNLMGSGVWGVGFAIVDARRRKLMRQLATTPMRRSHFLLAYMFSRLAFLVPEVVVLFGFGMLAFGTTVQGSALALGVLSLVGAAAFTGIGVLISARVDSSEAAAGWANLVMLPMWLCSGVFFSYEQFPAALQPAIRALPLTALTDAMRRVSSEAAPLSACASELMVLGVWCVVTFALALRMFRWQ